MSNSKMSRRQFLRWSAAGTSAAVLAACAPAPAGDNGQSASSTDSGGASSEPVELTWWHAWGGTGMDALTEVEQAFNEQSDDVKVVRTQVSEMNDKLLTAIAGGTPPDIGVCCVAYAQLFVRDTFTPLDDLIASSSVINKEEFVEGLFESMTWQGATYGVPGFECGPRYGFIYNLDLLEEAGLDGNSPPETWDEMYDWHVALTKFDDAGNVQQVGFDPRDATAGNGPRTNIPMFWGLTYGLDVFEQDTLTFNFDDERFVSALEQIKRFYDHVGVEKMQAFRDSFGGWTSSPTASFPSGVQANIVTGYYAPGEMANTAPDMNYTVSWAPTPEERRGVKFQSVGGHPVYIPVGSKDAESAFKFIEFATTDTTAEIMFNATGWLPGRKAFYDPARPGADQYTGLPWYLQSVQDADELWAGPIIPVDSFVNQERNRTFDAVVFGDKTPEQAAKDMQEACTNELANEFPELVG
ncbi:MAG: extracellular solute-binding protein [Chloroflexota bacterium]